MSTPTLKRRCQITWCKGPHERIIHPWVWPVVDPDGYERYFDTKREAVKYISEFNRVEG